QLLRFLHETRYLQERKGISKTGAWYQDVVYCLPLNRFRHFFRMNPDSFLFILAKINNHAVFHNNSKKKQADPMLQLFVALRRMGSEGSVGAAVMSTSQLFGIGEGTVCLYTNRVCVALQSLFSEVVVWQTPEEKDAMRSRLHNAGFSIFSECIGIVDGTLIPFKWRPYPKENMAIQYRNYRKSRYGLQATVVCDDMARILFFHSTFPGSSHDARCFSPIKL
ncbi:hypothetical protein L211DRAFT_755297, partial [Terfezia boudieri ATCC MYA-4762]